MCVYMQVMHAVVWGPLSSLAACCTQVLALWRVHVHPFARGGGGARKEWDGGEWETGMHRGCVCTHACMCIHHGRVGGSNDWEGCMGTVEWKAGVHRECVGGASLDSLVCGRLHVLRRALVLGRATVHLFGD